MAQVPYYGAYARFTTPDKKIGATLMGSDNLVGDRYAIEFRVEGGNPVPWLRNRFGKPIGTVEGPEAQELALCNARGWKVNAILASVCYSEQPEPGLYWGEVVLICYSKADEEAFDTFVQGVGGMLAKGIRPQIDLGQSGYSRVVETKGSWLPETRQKQRTSKKGQAVIKNHRSFNEGMIEAARKKNPGCMAVGIAFDIVLVIAVVWLLKSLLGF
ncbi:hypothetical protein [Curtanaerobium respiraculi]|uniref:hypothetical protein n=1 Tax=Curtanaerobium respiraculi TaxID=2949669 RepID=UPI0024B3BA57|nr:hypothetical protein [Curtanaerobium respiraculi]